MSTDPRRVGATEPVRLKVGPWEFVPAVTRGHFNSLLGASFFTIGIMTRVGNLQPNVFNAVLKAPIGEQHRRRRAGRLRIRALGRHPPPAGCRGRGRVGGVNELEFIRRQVSTERSHMAAVRSACAAALALPADERAGSDFLLACASYLVFVVGRFNAQDQAHRDLLRLRLPTDAARDRATLDDLDRTLAASRKALDALAATLRRRETVPDDSGDAALVAALRSYLSFYSNVLAGPRHSLQHLFAAHYTIAEWRAASAVDADSILEERRRYARVADLLPGGIALAALASDASPLAATTGREVPDPRPAPAG